MTAPTRHDERLRIDAFVDGQLELPAQLEMERRALTEEGMRAEVDEARRLRGMIRDEADYHAAPADFRHRMEIVLQAKASQRAADDRRAARSAVDPDPARHGRVRAWFGWRAAATAMAAVMVMVIAGNVLWLRGIDESRLQDEIVASHVRSTIGEHLLDVQSSDHHTVKPFLSLKLGFSPPVDELGIPGSSMLGGRVDYVDDRPVAALVYKQGQHVVNAFVWPDKAGDTAPKFSMDKGFQVAHWTQKGMTHWVISDVNRDEFGAIVRAMQIPAGTN